MLLSTFFTSIFEGFGIETEPSIVVSSPETQIERNTLNNVQSMPWDRSATNSSHSINNENNYSYGNKDLLTQSEAAVTQDALTSIPKEMRNGHALLETPLPVDAKDAKDSKEQKKSFMKMLNERMKSLSRHLQTAVKNYHKLIRERNSCLEVLGVQHPQDANADDVSLEDEIKKVLKETGYEPKSENKEEGGDQGEYNSKDE